MNYVGLLGYYRLTSENKLSKQCNVLGFFTFTMQAPRVM